MKLEILIATRAQHDWSLVEKMNLQCDSVIANQCGINELKQREYPWGTVTMLSSDTTGVGVNRNLALSAASGDILLFADDDLRYCDKLAEGVLKAFSQLPQADVLLFSIDITRNGELAEQRRHPVKRRHLWNSLRFGTYCIAIRHSAVKKHHLRFSTQFGGGCTYGSGEDTLFLRDCFAAGLKVYSHSFVLGSRSKDSSSWFCGCNEKFFYDKGALFTALSPWLSLPFSLYFLLKHHRKLLKELSFLRAFRLMRKGSHNYLRKEKKA